MYKKNIVCLFVATPACSSSGYGTLAQFNGMPLSWTMYEYNYTANTTAPTLMFSFRGDAAGGRVWFLDDVSVVAVTAPGIELLRNPSFDNSTTTLTHVQAELLMQGMWLLVPFVRQLIVMRTIVMILVVLTFSVRLFQQTPVLSILSHFRSLIMVRDQMGQQRPMPISTDNMEMNVVV
jgi:hypothetical protein